MNKFFSRMVFMIALILISAAAFSAQTKKAKKISYGERLITALINSKTLPADFGDEGVFFEASEGLSPDIVRILKLGKKAIPLLIRHLDDKQIMKHIWYDRMGYVDSVRVEVAVNEVALNILRFIVRREAPVFDLNCIENAPPLTPCVADDFYPGRFGRRSWQKAYRAGKIHYKKYKY